MRRLAIIAMLLAAGCGDAKAPAPVRSPAPPTIPAVTESPLPPGFVALSNMDSSILEDMRYATAHNFVGRPIDGYLAPRCLLTQPAAQALHQVQQALQRKGFGLKVYDCYRPLRAGEDFQRWATVPDADAMKGEFYPGLNKAALFTDGYVSNGKSAHSRGSTVDLTLVALPPASQRPFVPGEALVPCTAPVAQRFPDNTVDMGTGYDCFDTRSHPLDPGITGQAKQNRLLLRQAMGDAGFRPSTTEWWHFTLTSEPFPNDYFDFPVA